MSTEKYNQARLMAQIALGSEANVTSVAIRDRVRSIIPLIATPAEPIDEDALCRELETAFNIWMGEVQTLDSQEDHVPWLPDKRGTINWRFWKRYQRLLIEKKNFAPVALTRLDDITDRILERLEDSARDGEWDRRGMVVGQVQSGKTANYSGLICKAADAGYKLIIVLAGLHNNLRSQTQLRLDESFLGFDTRRNRSFSKDNARVGVGLLRGEPC